jgi:hypothetical protein
MQQPRAGLWRYILIYAEPLPQSVMLRRRPLTIRPLGRPTWSCCRAGVYLPMRPID